MFENLLIWLLERLYPKKDEPATPTVAVNVSQKQTVKRSVGRPRGSTKKTAVVAKTAAKKKAK
jgi:hypothetical protein